LKSKNNIAYFYWNWIIGGDGANAKGNKVSYRTALFLEKSLTAAYLIININTPKEGQLPPKHNLPCFKRDDPFNILQPERINRARGWINDAMKLFGK
jgi:hypothetical protein